MLKGKMKLTVSSIICTLALGLTAFLFPYSPSFSFLGEPEIPEILNEDIE